jgi:hypothetical protein
LIVSHPQPLRAVHLRLGDDTTANQSHLGRCENGNAGGQASLRHSRFCQLSQTLTGRAQRRRAIINILEDREKHCHSLVPGRERMEDQRQAGHGGSRTVPVQQDFLFVDAAQAKTSRQGRRNARSFVMQKARRERPWSTSKHAAKQRKFSGSTSTSPRSAGTPDWLLTPNSNLSPRTASPSPPLHSDGADYFTLMSRQTYILAKGNMCADCQIFSCRPGQRMCPRCLTLRPVSPLEDPDNGLFDPFGTSAVEMNASVTELLEHCKCLNPAPFNLFQGPDNLVPTISLF